MEDDLIKFEEQIREAQEGKKVKKDIVIMEEDEDTEEQKQDVEEERFETPDQVPKAEEPKEEKYEEVLDDEPEIKNYLEYKRILNKEKIKEKLTIDEQVFKDDWENQLKKEKKMQDETEKIAREEMERQKKYQDEIKAEYLATKEKNPEKIVRVNEKEISLNGGESIPKLIGFIFTMKTARKKGGKVLFAEPRGHVTRERFEKSLSIAQSCGFTLFKEIVIWKSHAAVLVKK
jgi:DNA polymerase III gamma/tau subunit